MEWITKSRDTWEFFKTKPKMTLKEVCIQFNISMGRASELTRLGEGFEKYPELLNCTSKVQALSALSRYKRDERLLMLSQYRTTEFRYDNLLHDTYHGFMSRHDTRSRFDTLITTLYTDTNIENLFHLSLKVLIPGARRMAIICRCPLEQVASILPKIRTHGYCTRANPLLWVSNNKVIGYIIIAHDPSLDGFDIQDVQYFPVVDMSTPKGMINVLLKHLKSIYVIDPLSEYGEVAECCFNLGMKYVCLHPTNQALLRAQERMK